MTSGLPPQNLDAEMALIGAMLHDPAVIDDVMAVVDAGDFFRDTHARVARAIFEMRSEGRRVGLITVDDELGGRDAGLLSDCMERGQCCWLAGEYAGIVREQAARRALIGSLNEGLRECYSGDFSAEELAARNEARAFAIGERGRGRREPRTASEAGASFLARLDAMRAGRDVPGVRTGFAELDRTLGGSEAGQLIIVGARPSMGKTAFALQWAMNAAEGQGLSSLVVSLEMEDEELTARMLSNRSGVFAHKFRTPALLNDHDIEALGRAQADFAGMPAIYIDDTPTLTAAQVAATARRLRSRANLGIVFVDYMQLVEATGARDSRQEQIAAISRRLKTMAREVGVPVVAMCQLNRKAEDREDKRPRMADLRESGQIEQDAHAVLLLHRPEYYDANELPGIAEVIVAKNRNGPTQTVKIAFNRYLTRFDDFQPEPGDGDY